MLDAIMQTVVEIGIEDSIFPNPPHAHLRCSISGTPASICCIPSCADAFDETLSGKHVQ